MRARPRQISTGLTGSSFGSVGKSSGKRGRRGKTSSLGQEGVKRMFETTNALVVDKFIRKGWRLVRTSVINGIASFILVPGRQLPAARKNGAEPPAGRAGFREGRKAKKQRGLI